MHPLLITDVLSKHGYLTTGVLRKHGLALGKLGPAKMFTFSSLHADSVYWSCMGFPQILSQRTFRAAARTGALLVVAVLRTTGSEIVS